MRAAPATRFTLAVGRASRLLVAAIFALAVGSTAFWAARKMAWPDEMSSAAAVAAALFVISVLLVYAPSAAVSLRWDGGLWHLARTADGAVEIPGELTVIVDIGPWMLLRFEAGLGVPPQWLSAHQGGVRPRWHALRCAVYSPRPAATPDASVEEAAL